MESEGKKLQAKVDEELLDVKTLRITNRELSEACERRAMTIEELRGRLELAEQRLDEAEEDKKRSITCACGCLSVCLFVHVCVCLYVQAGVLMCVCLCVCLRLRLCTRVCI